MAEQEIKALDHVQAALGASTTLLDEAASAPAPSVDNSGPQAVVEGSDELDTSSDVPVEAHEEQNPNEKTPFMISTISADQPAVCGRNSSPWQLVSVVSVFCSRLLKARSPVRGGGQCRLTSSEQGGLHDSLHPLSTYPASQHLRLLANPSFDETTSATSLLLQTITRLKEEIQQRNCKVILLSYIITKLRAEEMQEKKKSGVEGDQSHTSYTQEALVEEQLLKIKEQVVHLSAIVKESKSLYEYITENMVQFNLEPERVSAEVQIMSNCTSRGAGSSSSSASTAIGRRGGTALRPAETILIYSLRKISGLEELMRKREEEYVIRVKELEEMKEREKVLRENYEDQVKNLESKIQQTRQQEKKHSHNMSCYQTAVTFQQQQRALEQARAHVAALRAHHETEMAALKERVHHDEERYQEAQTRMQKAEQLLADHSIVDSAFYRDDSATPMLLQGATDGVKGAISMCASNIFKFTHDHSGLLNINIQYLHHVLGQHQLIDIVNGKNRKVVVKMALQAFLCELLFQSFESPAYSSMLSQYSSGMAFEKPEIRRKQRFQTFQRLRYLEPTQMSEQDPEFNSFLTSKAALVGKEIRQLLQIVYNGDESGTAQAQAAAAHEQLVGCELLANYPSSPFLKSFLRLAKAAWLLHKLAFACEPASAEIFRVAPNSVFQGDYMEEHEDTRSIAGHGNDDNIDRKQLVTLMNVPGFTVRNSVIRSVVCCVHRRAGPSQITS